MFASRNLVIIVALVGSIHAAIADEAADAVEILSQLWKGTSNDGSFGSQFVGDSKTFKMRTTGQMEDGTVFVNTTEAPFRFLEISDTPGGPYDSCSAEHSCIVVACLFKRECIVSTEVESDPVYRDPTREHTNYFKHAEEGGLVTPANADRVKQALRTLIGLNAPPPFNPSVPPSR